MVRKSADRDTSKLDANKTTMTAYHNLLFSFCNIINLCDQSFASRMGSKDKVSVPLECCRVLAMVTLESIKNSFSSKYNCKDFKVESFFNNDSNKGTCGQKNLSDYFIALENFNSNSNSDSDSKAIDSCLGQLFDNNDFDCFVDFSEINLNGNRDSCLTNVPDIMKDLHFDSKSSMSIITLIVNIIYLKQLIPQLQPADKDYEWLKEMWMRLCFVLYDNKYFTYKKKDQEYSRILDEYKLFKQKCQRNIKYVDDEKKCKLRASVKLIYSTIIQKFGLSESDIEEDLFRITHSLFEMKEYNENDSKKSTKDTNSEVDKKKECNESDSKKSTKEIDSNVDKTKECDGENSMGSVRAINSNIIKRLFNCVEADREKADSIIGNCLDNYYYIFSKSINIATEEDINENDSRQMEKGII